MCDCVLDETVGQALATAPTVVRQAALVIKDIDTELHEQAKTVQGKKTAGHTRIH